MPKRPANQPAASPASPREPSPVVDTIATAAVALIPALGAAVGVGLRAVGVGVGFGVVGVGFGVVGLGFGVTVGLIVFVGPGDGDALPEAEGAADGDMPCILPCHGLNVHGAVAKLGCGWSLSAAAKNLAHIGAQIVPP